MSDEPIPSPYGIDPPAITDEQCLQIEKIINSKQFFIISFAGDKPDHICTPDTCKGHIMFVREWNISPNQAMGAMVRLIEDEGFKVDLGDEEDEE